MQKKDGALRSISNSEDRLAVARLLDKSELAEKTRGFSHSDFLDPHQINLAQKLLPSLNVCEYTFFGGYLGAERAVAVFRSEFADEEETDEYQSGILKVIEITPLARNSLTHRDYLGALMSLGIKREVTGDILVKEEKCSIVVLGDIAAYIEGNLDKVGNIGISLKMSEVTDLHVQEPKAREIKTTLSALRLDSMCAPAFGISRSLAADFIKAGKVQLNWEVTINPDKAVHEGDTISLRGKGRAVLENVGGLTRKDRISVLIKKLV
ncbi:MAG TPA: YlmH/Sll1252 family protein [Clostridia bacterium]|nr:YlmH/Sll1252 family protein [Clostridia bacterium]